MVKRIAVFLCVLVLLTGMTACGAVPPAGDDGQIHVVAANFPAYDFARAVCGGQGEVSLLLPPGTESHSYEPTPKNMIDVQNCDLFVYTGGESDAWVETILDSLDRPVEALRMVDCVELLEEAETGAPGHDHGHDHGPGEVVELDEHVWTAPANAAAIVDAVAERLSAIDAAGAARYEANAGEYTEKLLALDGEFQAFFETVENRTMVFGDRFPLRYFAGAYDVDCYAAFPGCSTQTEPSAATVAFLIDAVREKRLSTVYYIEFSNHLVADSVAEAAGAETALFHSCHNVSGEELDSGVTYLSLMEQNLNTLRNTMS